MNNYNCLDLNLIKDEVSTFAYIEKAKEYILNEEVSFNPLVIKKNCKLTSEAIKLLKDELIINFDGIENNEDLFNKANKGICLDGFELYRLLVFHNHCQRIQKQFSNLDNNLDLRDFTDNIYLNCDIFSKIDNCIETNGDVKENASEKLKKINDDIKRLDKSLYDKAYQFIDKHASSLQEQSIIIRDNRITFLIKNADKNKYSGYTYGSSSSGLASYVEPQIFVELNNERLRLYADKNEEINRILIQLTYNVSLISNRYIDNFESLKLLCVIFAKARYGIDKLGIIAQINDSRYFSFTDLCHPLIDSNKVVSNSYRLNEPYNGIVISGSNTGGKTVSLKAIGLSIILTYLGIPIIATKASVPIYNNVYVDIDDNQSILDSLSTFSAHITNINNILNNANNKSLILIDELISGTDPKQAQAISLAILDKIKEKDAIFIITTHFDDIKNYAYNDPKILLSSVGFDMNSLKPTYKYYENSIGSSNALEIASRYFTDISIIENAKKYIEKNETENDKLLKKLTKEIEDYQIDNELLNKSILEYQNNNLILKEKINNFELEKQELKNKYINELNVYIENIKLEAKEKLKEINDHKQLEKLNNFKNDVENLIVVENRVEFNIGDNVRIKNNEQIGQIIDIKNNKVIVEIRGLKINTTLDDLTLMPKVKKKQIHQDKKMYKRVKSEINVVGQRVEEGLIIVEEYLDAANASNMSKVKIIHGIGTGALRKAIRDKLKKLSYVNKYYDGDFYDGGSAVTMVEFK